ncbi:hypothetical protein T09_14424 [Trichinella sp. T9]|nr:hypothetical protein T09_14424 [Trichinella sp. T9]
MTELLGAEATGNDWSGVLLRSRTEAETLYTDFCRNQSQLKTVAIEQLEGRWMESKIPSTKMENHFHRHCVRNLLVRDP